MNRTASVAVLIPAFNEATTIQDVIEGFKNTLPRAKIYVYDNGSTDETAVKAAAAGATVRREFYRGKGNVVRRMFADIEADQYVLVDADATYDPAAAPQMLRLMHEDHLDMVVGVRESTSAAAYRSGHRLGNRILSWIIGAVFGKRFTDVLSGYRVFSRRFVKSFPALSSRFEIETELSVHALEMRVPTAELRTSYRPRRLGSESKLRTVADGMRIFRAIFSLARTTQPLKFFGIAGFILAMVPLIMSLPVFQTYLETGLVPRFPTVILASALMVVSVLSVTSGVILHHLTRMRLEMKRLHYLSASPYTFLPRIKKQGMSLIEDQVSTKSVEQLNTIE